MDEKQLASANLEALLKAAPEKILEEASRLARLRAAKEAGVARRRALLFDPWTLMWGLYHQSLIPRRSRVDFPLLRQVAEKNEVAAAIVKTRVEQVTAFAQVAKRKGDRGFRVVHDDPKYEATEFDLKRAEKLQQILWNTGSIRDPDREKFPEFLAMLVRDLMTLDQIAIEIQRNVRGEPVALWALDAATIYRCKEEGFEGDDSIRYVQILPTKAEVEKDGKFTADDLLFGVKNPVTDVRKRGYGLGWLEQAINVITAYLFAFQHNKSYFTDNHLPRGVILMHGSFDQENLESFQRQWLANLMGVQSAWRTPILGTESEKAGVDFVRFDERSNKDMEFMRWMFLLITVMCSLAGMDPAELGFHFSFSGTSTLFGHNEDAHIKESKDKGLKGVLSFFANKLTEIVKRFDGFEDWHFEFVGVDPEDEESKIRIRDMELKAFKTVDEVRAEEGLDPIGEEKGGDIIPNPAFQTALQQRQMMEQAQQMGGQPMMPGMPGPSAGGMGGPTPEAGAPEAGAAEGGGAEAPTVAATPAARAKLEGLPPEVIEMLASGEGEEEEEEAKAEVWKALGLSVELEL